MSYIPYQNIKCIYLQQIKLKQQILFYFGRGSATFLLAIQI